MESHAKRHLRPEFLYGCMAGQPQYLVRCAPIRHVFIARGFTASFPPDPAGVCRSCRFGRTLRTLLGRVVRGHWSWEIVDQAPPRVGRLPIHFARAISARHLVNCAHTDRTVPSIDAIDTASRRIREVQPLLVWVLSWKGGS